VLHTIPIDRVLCQPSPLGYNLIAREWNAQALKISPRHFAIIDHATSQNQHPGILTNGKPMSMDDFLVTTKDCDIPITSPVDSEVQALTHYMAMGTTHSCQKHEAIQQQHQTCCLATFRTMNLGAWIVCQ
jgi:hypothetical protein